MQGGSSALARKVGISAQEEREIRTALGDEQFEKFVAAILQKKEQKPEHLQSSSPVRRRARIPEWKSSASPEPGGKERRFDLVGSYSRRVKRQHQSWN